MAVFPSVPQLVEGVEVDLLARTIDRTRMARPTAASAAASAMTKKANTWPFWSPSSRAKASNARLPALSCSSMPMSTMSALRRSSTPVVPMRNSANDRPEM